VENGSVTGLVATSWQPTKPSNVEFPLGLGKRWTNHAVLALSGPRFDRNTIGRARRKQHALQPPESQ
jgi:hypothetical protein